MYNIADYILMFFVYAFLGWCLEIAYNGLMEGHYVNRGFLNGPICPIYGVGAVIVVGVLTPLKNGGHVMWLIFVAALICTGIELVTGFVLEKLYKTRWWDYSNKPFNLGGYICLEFSVYWGVACLALMYGLHPVVYESVLFKLPTLVKTIAVAIFGIIFIVDMVATLITLKHLKGRAEALTAMGEELLSLSETLGHVVYGGAVGVERIGEETGAAEKVKQARERYNDVKEKYETLAAEKHRSHEHLLNAFKQAKSEKYDAAYNKLREKLNERNPLKRS